MAEGHVYKPITKVEWNSNEAFTQFKLWRKRVERILGGPLAAQENPVKINYIFIWGGAHAENLIDARINEVPETQVDTLARVLNILASCLTHTTFFREAREDFYSIRQKPGENTTAYYSRLIEIFNQAQFPDNCNFLVVDKLIHSCDNIDCKRKLMSKTAAATVHECLEIMRRYEAVNTTMKRINESASASAQVNATYNDPTKKSQAKAQKNKSSTKKPSRKPDKKCSWCGGSPHSREECPARDAVCNFCEKDGHFEETCFKKKSLGKPKYKKHHAVQAGSGEESEYEYEDGYDLKTISIDEVKSSPREVIAEVEFHHKSSSETNYGKVDTGAMVN